MLLLWPIYILNESLNSLIWIILFLPIPYCLVLYLEVSSSFVSSPFGVTFYIWDNIVIYIRFIHWPANSLFYDSNSVPGMFCDCWILICSLLFLRPVLPSSQDFVPLMTSTCPFEICIISVFSLCLLIKGSFSHLVLVLFGVGCWNPLFCFNVLKFVFSWWRI